MALPSHKLVRAWKNAIYARNFLLVDLLGKKSDLEPEGKEKSSENNHLTGHFQSCFFSLQNKQ